MVVAIIMAGGKGTRMKLEGEKPLLVIKGKPMIQCVLEAVLEAREVDGVVVATSKHTPQTSEFLRKSGLKVIETPGEGYIEDLGFLLVESWPAESELKSSDDILVTVTADLPLINGKIIDQVIKEYKNCGKPAMCVAVPLEFFAKYGLKPDMVLGDVVPSGLNILRRNNNQQDEEVLRLSKFELALNINSPEDIISLEKFLD
jgi:adenosylcobinamide-phosphate guanylyltransferase